MPSHVPRKFTVLDAMVLIAATGIALAPIRYLSLHGRGLPLAAPYDWTIRSLYLFGSNLSALLLPFVLTGSMALGMLRLRKPRPPLRRIFRQPGMATCTAVLVSTLFFLAACLGLLLVGGDPVPIGYIFEHAEIYLKPVWYAATGRFGEVIAAVWIVLWLSRAWCSEPSWIDRAGRILGIYCVVNGVLFGWASWMG
jgi:hypothetical protein